MKLAFYLSQFSLRGTENSTYDYARYAEEILGHESIIVGPASNPLSDSQVEQKFASRFRVIKIDAFDVIDQVLREQAVDLLYIQKSGENDGKVSREVPTCVHAVFLVGHADVHGDRYAFISDWLATRCSGGAIASIPYIVTRVAPTTDIRSTLGIPADAAVFGTYGGPDSFDIEHAKRAVRTVLQRRSDSYFCFMNTRRFVDHPRAIFLPGTSDLLAKANFVASCDAMIHARHRGETFGLACAEFSIQNKPVITYAGSPERCHLAILGDRAMTFTDQQSLERIFLDFDRADAGTKDWDCYSRDFAPSRIMARFDDAFIQGNWNTPSLISVARHQLARAEARVIARRDRVWTMRAETTS